MRGDGDLQDPLRLASDGEPASAPDLRDVSDRLLVEISRIRHLELESRRVPIGSPDFVRLSGEIATRSQSVFRLSREQEAMARGVAAQATTINDLIGGVPSASGGVRPHESAQAPPARRYAEPGPQ